MPLDLLALIVRGVIALALLVFLAALFRALWQDVAFTSQQVEEGRRSAGSLTIVECEDVPLEPGQRYPLIPFTTLGRAPTCTVVVPDSFASNDHAHIVLRGGQWWLEDQRSRNGTLLNDIRVTDSVVLSSGDIVSVGRVKMRVELS